MIGIYTVNHKNVHFVFYYNYGITCSIFIIFVPVKTGRNTVEYSTIYLFDDVMIASQRTLQKFTSYG